MSYGCIFRNEAFGPGTRTAALTEVFGILSKQPHIFRGATDASGYHVLNLRPTAAADNLAAFQLVGALAAYITCLIREFLPTQAAILEAWPKRLTSSVDVSLGSQLSEIAVEYLDVGVCLATDVFFLWTLTLI